MECCILAECEGDSPQSCDVGINVHVSKNQERFLESFVSDQQPCPLFLEENKALDIGTDNQFSSSGMGFPTSIDYDANSNSSIQDEIALRKDVAKETPREEENLKALITHDPDNQGNSIDDAKYKRRKNGSSRTGSKTKSRKRIGRNKDSPPTSGIFDSAPFAKSTEECEQVGYMNTNTTFYKTEENQSDFHNVVIKVEPESKIIDSMDSVGISYGTETRLSPIHSDSKTRNQSPNLTSNIYCKECEHTFKKRFYYEKHLKEDRCKRICEYCGKEFLYNGAWRYMIHMRYHKKQKDQECKICGKLFIEKSKMVQHVKFHTNPKPKICEKCGKGFPTTVSLKLHMANMHVENKDMVQCSQCAKMYTNKSSLQYHMRSAHDFSIFFPCLTCNKTFKHKRLLTIHELTHKETRDFKCDKCEATFKRASGLLAHQKRHEKAYKFFCETCNKGFYEKRKLQQHENIHTGTKPFKCSVCDYKCAFEGNLSKHMKIHKTIFSEYGLSV